MQFGKKNSLQKKMKSFKKKIKISDSFIQIIQKKYKLPPQVSSYKKILCLNRKVFFYSSRYPFDSSGISSVRIKRRKSCALSKLRFTEA